MDGLWTCPECGRRFANRHQTHTCRPLGSLEDKASAARLVEKAVLPGFASGDLSVPVAASYPLDDVDEAYKRFKSGGKLGKIVLEIAAQ